MSTIDRTNLHTAGTSFGLANTPTFLLRRLQNDSAVSAIRAGSTDDELLQALRVALATEPKTLEDAVRPYVLLVALSRSSDVRKLDAAQQIQPRPEHFDWYFEILRVLRDSKPATSYSSIKLSQPRLILRSSATNLTKKES